MKEEERKLNKKYGFYQHDAMWKCGLCCRPVSIHLSVTLVDCLTGYQDEQEVSQYLQP